MARLRVCLKTHLVVIASAAKQSLPLSLNYSEIASSPEFILSGSTRLTTGSVEGAPRNDSDRPVYRRAPSRYWLFAVPRRVWRISMAALAFLMASTTLAQAHGGGGGPEVVLPPIFTSGLLGFVCYWLVILWPSSKKEGDTEVRPDSQNWQATRTRPRPRKHSARMRRVPRLRKIEGSGQVRSDSNSGRRAIDV
jgi:hypothetical protein